MDKLSAMEMFVRIVETGSFSAVARETGMTQPTVSKQLTALERRLNALLLNRSTRHLNLTEAGTVYYERCRKIIDSVRAAENRLGKLQTALAGTLHVNSSVAFGQNFLAQLMLRFQASNPEVNLTLTLNDRFVDLVEEGVDVAIRFGHLADSNLVARALGSTRLLVLATPGYLDKFGTPLIPEDLVQHNCIHYTYLSSGNDWVFPGKDGEIRVRISGTFRSNNGYALRDALLAGAGIAVMPEIFVYEPLQQGKVRPVLEHVGLPRLPINAVYSSARHISAKVRALIDFLRVELPALPGIIALSPAPPAPAEVH